MPRRRRPRTGGPAEIVLQERDATLRDQRGARAFRVSFVGQGGSVLRRHHLPQGGIAALPS